MSEFSDLLKAAGEISNDARMRPLTGGVSSDIYLVEDQGTRWVAKRALEKLKVAADWRANVERYVSEYRYMQCVDKWLPGATPQVRSVGKGYFTMNYLGDGFDNLKQLLLSGKINPVWGTQAGKIMGTIHARSWADDSIKQLFETTADFESLRLDPYLRHMMTRYPDLKSQLELACEKIKSNRVALVHGDFSPKNILVSNERLVVLDCEVAWYGDPTFDVAFFTNHIVIKSLHLPDHRAELQSLAQSFWNSYRDALGADRANHLLREAARLQWFLMLARVDGKSPVEYLSDSNRDKIRKKACEYLREDFYPTLDQTFELLNK